MDSFLTSIFAVVVHTPLWVWPLYALLLFLGFSALAIVASRFGGYCCFPAS